MGARCVFLDRDGVLNRERGDYTFLIEDFEIVEGVKQAVKLLKDHNYLLIIITNQAGISRGIYSRGQMQQCHNYLQDQCGHLFDSIYYCPYHPTISASIARKPGSLMFEKAINKFVIDVNKSWMVGDKTRDLVPAKKLGLRTVFVGDEEENQVADYTAASLKDAVDRIILAAGNGR